MNGVPESFGLNEGTKTPVFSQSKRPSVVSASVYLNSKVPKWLFLPFFTEIDLSLNFVSNMKAVWLRQSLPVQVTVATLMKVLISACNSELESQKASDIQILQ